MLYKSSFKEAEFSAFYLRLFNTKNMTLSYGVQAAQALITAYTLTADFGAANGTATIVTEGLSELALYVTYTPGAGGGGNNINVRVQASSDRFDAATTTWFQDVASTTAAGTITLTQATYTFDGAVASTAYTFRILVPIADRQIQVSVSETVGAGVAGVATVSVLKSGAL